MNNKVYLIVIVLLMYSCRSNNENNNYKSKIYPINNFPITKVSINSDIQKVFSSSIFDSVIYEPFETKQNSLFEDVKAMEVFGDLVIILEPSGKSLLLFKKNGEFIYRIDKNRLNQNVEKISSKFRCFAIDKVNNLIVVYDQYKSKLFNFSFSGKLVSEINMSFYFDQFTILDESIIFYSGYSPFVQKMQSMNQYNMMFFSNGINGDEPITNYRLYNLDVIDKPKTFTNQKVFFSKGDNSKVLFSHTYSNWIYELESKGIKNIYQINLPKQYESLPIDFLINEKYNKDRVKFVRESYKKDIIWNISDIYWTENNKLIIKVSSTKRNFKTYIIDIEQKKNISLDEIIYDSITNFFPVTNSHFFASDGNCLYGLIPASRFVKLINKFRRNKNFTVSPRLKNINNLSNPILVKAYLKNNIKW